MTKRDLVVAEWQLPDSTLRACWNITRDDRARLVWSNRDFFPHTTNLLTVLTFLLLKFLICIHAGNPRVPPQVLAQRPKPCGGNKHLTNKKGQRYLRFKKRARCHSFMGLNRVSDVSAVDWLSQTRENYRNFSLVALPFFLVMEFVIKHSSICT